MEHSKVKVYFKKPILCVHCDDYIWGINLPGKQCTKCYRCMHTACHLLYKKPCDKKPYIVPLPATSSHPIALATWSCEDVCDWMAVVSLHRYSELFKKNNVAGGKLENLNKEKISEMRIRDEFHTNSILFATQALKQQPQQHETPLTSIQERNHQFSIYSFTSLQDCCVCGGYLLGIIQQGYQCRVCGLCCHRRCRVLQLPECGDKRVRKRNSFIQDCLFGKGLDEFATSPPPLISLCTQELHNRAVNDKVSLLHFYRQTPLTMNVLQLQKSLVQDSTTDFETTATTLKNHTAETIGGIVKKFLRDLPDSVIPDSFYSSFIQIVTKDLNSVSTKELLSQLPACHYTSLEFLLGHLTSDQHCDNKVPEKLAHIFSNILLRPPWDQIIDIVHNSKLQSETLLFLMTRKDELFSGEEQALDISEIWYFGEVSRYEVDELMMNCQDGSFLVRNAGVWDPSEPYTLTLRKNGTNKLIKIGRWGGVYGLSSSPPLFATVKELVNHYKQHSLSTFHRSLDITLQYPLERETDTDIDTQVDKHTLRKHFMEACKEVNKLMEMMEELNGEYDKFNDVLRMYYNDLEAIKKVIEMYAQQMETSRSFMKQRTCNRDMRKYGEDGVRRMERKKNTLEMSKSKIEGKMGETKKSMRVVAESLEQKKENLKVLETQKEMKKKTLMELNESQANIELLQSGKDVQDVEEIAHMDEKMWLVSVDRKKAIELLMGKASGTFLIRPRPEGSNHALSIVSQNKEVVHCMIEKTESCYGFTDPYFIHPRLTDLVLHYKDVSLKEHNDTLEVTLQYPVYAT